MKRIINKNYFIPLFTLIITVGFTRCSNEYEMLTESETKIPVIFTFAENMNGEDKVEATKAVYNNENDITVEIIEETEWPEQSAPKTRTSWSTGPNANNYVTWVQGDEIGIYKRLASGIPNTADRNNVRYRVTSSTKESNIEPVNEMLYFTNATSEVRFLAYYPYSDLAGNDANLNYTLPVDQTNQSSLSKADIMYASSSDVNASRQTVPLHFNHKMSLLTVRLSSTFLNYGIVLGLKSISIHGPKVTNKGTLNLVNGNVITDPSSLFKPICVVNKDIESTFYADFIINPCTINNTTGGSTFVNYEDFLVTVVLSYPSWQFTRKIIKGTHTFEPGKRYIINVTI